MKARAWCTTQRNSHKSRIEIWEAGACVLQSVRNVVHAWGAKRVMWSTLLQFSWFIPPAVVVIDVTGYRPLARARIDVWPRNNVSGVNTCVRNFAVRLIRHIKNVLMIFMIFIYAGRNQFRDCIANSSIEKRYVSWISLYWPYNNRMIYLSRVNNM